LHDTITVADIVVPEGVTILTNADHPIAAVVETPAQASEEAEAADSADGNDESNHDNATEATEKESAEQPKQD
jgi:hypothetical protein